jgi:ketosteroid isomerase-like protein
MRRRFLFLTLLAAMTVSIMSAPAMASSEDGVGRIPTVTRLVRIFFQLEGELSKAVEQRDMPAVSKLLSDDFEMRVSTMPGTPIPRAVWIQQSFSEPKSSSTLEQMAVHGFGKIAVVSYSWKIKAAKSKMMRDIFIVDTWRQEAGAWRLAVRYAGPGAQGDYLIPGVPTIEPAFEKKE